MELRWPIPVIGPALAILIGHLFLDDWLDRQRLKRGFEKETRRLKNLRWKSAARPRDRRLLGRAIPFDRNLQKRLTANRWPVARTGKECGYCGYHWNPVLTTGSCPSCGYDRGWMLVEYVHEGRRLDYHREELPG